MGKATVPRRRRAERPPEKGRRPAGLPKCPSGIQGLDDILAGGLPRGRTTLVCGGPGCGKSLFGAEFLARGAADFGEPGVLMTFEETPAEIIANTASLGIRVDDLIARGLLAIDFVRVERSEIEETGEYDLEGLFVRLAHAVDTIKAKRLVLDTLETLFTGLKNTTILRAELRRLFRWVKDRGLTCVVTGEQGEKSLTRHGLEEYISDCVIFLDHRVSDQVSTRRLRVVKYRGSTHGTNEFPFLIDRDGISVMPITSAALAHGASTQRVSSGIERLDAMLAGEGFYRGSSVLVSGTAGTGKSSLAASFADATCRRGERCLYFGFEESRDQILRNMRSIGLDLSRHVAAGLLEFSNRRPTMYGLEMHLALMIRHIRDFAPSSVVVDPITNLMGVGGEDDAERLITRLVDYMKSQDITSLFTGLTHNDNLEGTELGISSIMDAWLLLRDIELQGERNRGLYILKARGIAHSNQIREFLITREGIQLLDVYVGPEGVLTGSARLTQETRERAGRLAADQAIERLRRTIERKERALQAQVAALRDGFEQERDELLRAMAEQSGQRDQLAADRRQMAVNRRADKDNHQAQGFRAKARK